MTRIKRLVVLICTCGLAASLMGSLAGCDTLARITLEGVSNSKIRYGSQCESLRLQCREANYSEWETSERRRGCSCAKEPTQSRSPADIQPDI